MNGSWGNRLGINIFGESHGKVVGVVINNLPAGIEIDVNAIKIEMDRRRPSSHIASTSRKESDEFEIYSGYFDNHTTGAPFMVMIYNSDTRSNDYEAIKNILRPSHADWSAYQKYNGFHDYRGGGIFSGRLTAAIVFAGAIAKQMLSQKNIVISSEVLSIGSIKRDMDAEKSNNSNIDSSEKKENPLTKQMMDEIYRVKKTGDSIGGTVKITATGINGGLGGTLFENVEGRISQMIFSIPAVKGIAFGMGFAMADSYGSVCNDELEIADGNIQAKTNNNGGILGGITTGMPIEFTVAIKPTPTIAREQCSVNIEKMENVKMTVSGRHDACIVPRVLPVLECATALVLLDLILDEQGNYK